MDGGADSWMNGQTDRLTDDGEMISMSQPAYTGNTKKENMVQKANLRVTCKDAN